ncbi:MAG: KamA family radical SAM protein [Candidatus Glassbacteria bacterium]|nr:KamA family radical SAM protein [Candidatus Glassbacteria bacterium]
MSYFEGTSKLKIRRPAGEPAAETGPRGPSRLYHGRGRALPYSTDAILELSKEELLKLLWKADRRIYRVLKDSTTIMDCRNNLFGYLNDLVRSYYNIYSEKKFKDLHPLEKVHAKRCVRILKNTIRTGNEKITGVNPLNILWKLARGKLDLLDKATPGFLCEMIFLFLGINGKLAFYRQAKQTLSLFTVHDENPGLVRSHDLDQYSERIDHYFSRYPSGLDPGITVKQQAARHRIMEYFGAGERQWNDYRWQLKHIIRDRGTVEALVGLTRQEREGLILAEKHGIVFQITPYYLSLFDPEPGTGVDAAVRAQVLPGKQYVKSLVKALRSGANLDFMGETCTSPVEGITRRYAKVLILKAFNSCPQICVYCQRNWEINSIDNTRISRKKLLKAIDWIADNRNIEEVLVTGGDPLTLGDDFLAWVMDRLAAIDHLERIRISTRVPVTMPSRITAETVDLVSRYHEFGRREVCFVTHYESPLEMTPESLAAIRRIRSRGLNVYNQQVFTYYNSRKFETSALRKLLKLCGVDPYYCFNTKGKDETWDYRVPIARLLQEWTEEARLLPGMVRTDTPVFNVPTLGKSYLHSWQDHDIIMILPDGRRVYRFNPWESMFSLAPPYIYTDVPIYEYLKRLQRDGEDVNDYHSIWYYF